MMLCENYISIPKSTHCFIFMPDLCLKYHICTFIFFLPFSLLFTKVPSDLCLFNNKPMGLRDVKMNKNHSMIDFNSTVECNV